MSERNGPDMDATEARLRDAIGAYTEAIEPAPDAWEMLQEATVNNHGWNARLPILAIAGAVAVAAAFAGFALFNDNPTGKVVTPPATDAPTTNTKPSTTTTDAPKPTTTTTAPVLPAEPPVRMVAGTADGRVVELRENGSIAREVVQLPAGKAPAQVRLQGDTVWFVETTTDELDVRPYGCGSLYRVPLSGGAPEQVISEKLTYFAVSPAGDRIAFTRHYSCPGEPVDQAPRFVKMLQIATGETRELSFRAGGLDWSPDGSRLIVDECGESCWIQLYDPSTGTIDERYRDAVANDSGHGGVFLKGGVWTIEPSCCEHIGRWLFRYDIASGTQTKQESPFADYAYFLYGGPSDSLLAFSPGYRSDSGEVMAGHLERWNLSGTPVTLPLDPTIRSLDTD